MKTMKIFFAIMLSVIISGNLSAQSDKAVGKTKTESVKVLGECGMCKSRIEKTAKSDDVTSAAWDAKTKMLTVSYDPSKTSADAIAKKIAAVGHDTEKFKADEKVYNALPGCCKYDRAGTASATDHSGHNHK